jgi:peptidase S41-like protein
MAPVLHAQQPARPLSSAERRAVVDTVEGALLRVYVLRDAASEMVVHLEKRRAAGAFDRDTNPNALAAAITRELRDVYRDAHLRVVYDPEEEARMADTNHREVRDTRERDRRMNFMFSDARVLPGNIGYVAFHQFADTSAESRRTVRAAMQFVANSDALVLDLRDNRGGSVAMSREITSYFVRDSARWSRSYDRWLDRWSDEWIRNDSSVTGGTWLGMPIMVLVSPWTFSAAEGLAYGLQHERGARVVGDSTAGGAHTVRRVGLGHGFVGFIPYVRPVYLATNSNWEGTGVIPDVHSDAPGALLTALERILLERRAAAKDSGAMRAADFALNAARAAEHLVNLPVRTLARYAGTFEEYTFFVRDGRLYTRNRNRNGRTDRLATISPTLFQIDRESQVEFVPDASGKVAAIRLLWNDGWVDRIGRTGR